MLKTNMEFKIEFPNYESNHVEMWYGKNYTPLFSLTPKEANEKDFSAHLVVNGEWSFSISLIEGPDEAGISRDYWMPDQITPEIELIIKNTIEDTFEYQGSKYQIDWESNNWFEIFIDIFKRGEWHEYSYDVIELLEGPTIEEAKRFLEDAVRDSIDNLNLV